MRISCPQSVAAQSLARSTDVTQDAASVQSARPVPSLQAQKLKFFTFSGRNNRQGAAAVEFAFVAVILFLLIFGIIEFARILWMHQQLVHAAREGARRGVLPNSTQAEVQQVVREWLDRGGVPSGRVNIQANVPAAQGLLVEVTVSANYTDIGLVPTIPLLNQFFEGKQLTATVRMVKEANDNI